MKKGIGTPNLNHSTTYGGCWPSRGGDTSHPRITLSPARAVTNRGSSLTPWAPGGEAKAPSIKRDKKKKVQASPSEIGEASLR